MADLKRFFVDCDLAENQVVLIEGEEFKHAVSVLRIQKGESIILLNNTDCEFVATVGEVGKKSITAVVEKKQVGVTEPAEKLCLVCGFLKGDKTELVVQKAVELGVTDIVVFNSEFCSAFMSDNKLARLNKVSQEAAKQCKRTRAPKVTYFNNLQSALLAVDAKNKLFACEFAAENQVNFSALSGSTAVVVGSEGGFSQKEYQSALSLGYKTVYLGKRILRAETCCIALCALLSLSKI